jgi:LmbE family N-acetylglucosaminyl deacetylase
VTLPSELAGARRVLAVQPHYDDNDIGAGGTLAALAAAGAEVHYLTVTDDLVGVLDASLSDAEARDRLRAEQDEAGRAIGVATQAWLDFPDAGDYAQHDVRRGVIEHIRRVRPDVLFTVDPWLPTEAHEDHRKTGFAVAGALLTFRFPRLPTSSDVDAAYFSEAADHAVSAIAFYFTVEPTDVVDVAGVRVAKHRALDAYRSQFTSEGLAALHRGLELRERQWAGHAGGTFEHGEPLKVRRPFELHCHFPPA